MNRLRHQLFAGAGLAANQHVQIRGGNNVDLLFQLRHARRQADHPGGRHRLEDRGRARKHILALQLLNQQGIIESPCRQSGNQPQLLIAEVIETIRRHAVEGQGANQVLPGKQRQADAGVHLQILLAWNKAIIGIGQIAIRREAHHVPCPGDGLQPRVPFQRKTPPQHVRRETVDGQGNKLPRAVAQQRRGVAA